MANVNRLRELTGYQPAPGGMGGRRSPVTQEDRTGKGTSSQTLKGNGATPPPVKRDAPSSLSKQQLSDARRKAIANLTPNGEANSSSRRAMRNARGAEAKSPQISKLRGARDFGPEDSGIVDSPLGRRLKESGKKNPFLRVN